MTKIIKRDPYYKIVLIVYKKFSRGQICVANFIPPVNGASQGNNFLPKSHKCSSTITWISQCLTLVLWG